MTDPKPSDDAAALARPLRLMLADIHGNPMAAQFFDMRLLREAKAALASHEAQPGMSLRDYFAGRLPVRPEDLVCARKREHARMLADKTCMYREREDDALEAEIRYRKADAMLTARKEPQDKEMPA